MLVRYVDCLLASHVSFMCIWKSNLWCAFKTPLFCSVAVFVSCGGFFVKNLKNKKSLQAAPVVCITKLCQWSTPLTSLSVVLSPRQVTPRQSALVVT